MNYSNELDRIENGSSSPSPRSMRMAREAAKSMEESGLRVDKVSSLPDGGVVLYAFGTKNVEGIERHVHAGIVADDDDENLSGFLTVIGISGYDEYFDVLDVSESSRRIISFMDRQV